MGCFLRRSNTHPSRRYWFLSHFSRHAANCMVDTPQADQVLLLLRLFRFLPRLIFIFVYALTSSRAGITPSRAHSGAALYQHHLLGPSSPHRQGGRSLGTLRPRYTFDKRAFCRSRCLVGCGCIGEFAQWRRRRERARQLQQIQPLHIFLGERLHRQEQQEASQRRRGRSSPSRGARR